MYRFTIIYYDLRFNQIFLTYKEIKLLKNPLGLREIIFNPVIPKLFNTNKGYVEVKVGIAPNRT